MKLGFWRIAMHVVLTFATSGLWLLGLIVVAIVKYIRSK